LYSGDKLAALVEGALISAIDTHGPVMRSNTMSATKRIVGAIRGEEFAQGYVNENQYAQAWRRKYEALKHGHAMLVARHNKSRSTVAALARHCAVPIAEVPGLDEDQRRFVLRLLAGERTFAGDSQ